MDNKAKLPLPSSCLNEDEKAGSLSALLIGQRAKERGGHELGRGSFNISSETEILVWQERGRERDKIIG